MIKPLTWNAIPKIGNLGVAVFCRRITYKRDLASNCGRVQRSTEPLAVRISAKLIVCTKFVFQSDLGGVRDIKASYKVAAWIFRANRDGRSLGVLRTHSHASGSCTLRWPMITGLSWRWLPRCC